MKLNAWVAEKKRQIFEDLRLGHPPRAGEFDQDLLNEARAKGQPQMGTVRFEPNRVMLEFIYSDPASSATVVTVVLAPPQRIVFLPVPGWVIESIWQGDIDGSHHFESDARDLVAEFVAQLEPETNAPLFGPQPAKRRE
jgi:hypothetical protein